MIIPYGTDAPIYHFPWMTIGIIFANGLSFIITSKGMQTEGWLLTYGCGLHPLEWLTYNFLHFDASHLIGNMFFLWAFGIVIEGKLGWWRFLCLYLAIGALGGILIQTSMLWYVPPEILTIIGIRPGAGGASLAIYGLMAIALIWAPRNQVTCFYWLGYGIGTFEPEYLYFCGFFIVTQLLLAWFSHAGFVASSEIGHATGAVIGFVFGTLFLSLRWVDCEKWDIFSLIQGKHNEELPLRGY